MFGGDVVIQISLPQSTREGMTKETVFLAEWYCAQSSQWSLQMHCRDSWSCCNLADMNLRLDLGEWYSFFHPLDMLTLERAGACQGNGIHVTIPWALMEISAKHCLLVIRQFD